MRASNNGCAPINRVYFLSLIDWETKILGPEELEQFSNKIMKPPQQKSDGWITESLKWPKLEDIVSNMEWGYYHSRLIFKFDLKSAPKNIFKVREVRKRLEEKIEQFLLRKVIPVIKDYIEKPTPPTMFTYPIFELSIEGEFWNLDKWGQKPYSLPTTCFFTELDDPEGKKVKMRVSGAKIISSEMSEWFFNNLVNIIFHEGLYRQTRDKQKLSNEWVYKGLENRLENFASRLMTTFHEFSSEFVRRHIAKIGLYASIFIPFVIIIINLLLKLWK